MIENEHNPIDRYFKENFEKLEVQYNPSHWKDLQSAMALATAGGLAAASLPHSTWLKLLNKLKSLKLLLLFSLMILIVTCIYIFEKAGNSPSININNSENSTNEEITQEAIPGNLISSPAEGSPNQNTNQQIPSLLLPDTTLPALVLKADSIDSTSVDSSKVFIFW